ncbi:MAG: type II secretion system F family protein, partial [Acidimicrobiia bacterium]
VLILVFAFLAVKSVASREKKRFNSQLPDTLTLTSTSLRAGYSLLQAVEAVAQESPEPTRREFGRALTEIRLGRPMIDALGDIAVRMESQDFEWAVLAISIQREVGGNLAEVLQTTAEMMNQRDRLRREMKALTAEGRISAVIMGVLPFFLFGLISFVNPSYLAPLYSTPIGLGLVGFAILLIIAGVVWMQKIINIEV